MKINPLFQNASEEKKYKKGINSEADKNWLDIKKEVLKIIEFAYLLEKNINFNDLDDKTKETISIILDWVNAYFEDGLEII